MYVAYQTKLLLELYPLALHKIQSSYRSKEILRSGMLMFVGWSARLMVCLFFAGS